MKVYELINKGTEILNSNQVPDGDIDATLLFLHVFGWSKMKLSLDKQLEADEDLALKYMELISVRASRYPLQYITGVADFMGYEFYTDNEVLIPRMDTENLVLKALELIDKKPGTAKVLDMCCGSGCIGISIKLAKKDIAVTLADISDKALALTEKNCEKLGAACDIIKSDLFENINEKYDFIVSNPPYIRTEVIDELMPEVKDFEPRLALDGSSDGLLFYKAIVADAHNYLKEDGYVLFEIGNDQAEDVDSLFVDAGYEDVQVIKDLGHNDRVILGRLKSNNK